MQQKTKEAIKNQKGQGSQRLTQVTRRIGKIKTKVFFWFHKLGQSSVINTTVKNLKHVSVE